MVRVLERLQNSAERRVSPFRVGSWKNARLAPVPRTDAGTNFKPTGPTEPKSGMRLALASLATTVVALAGVAIDQTAHADTGSMTSIEGIWSFNGGQIAIVKGPDRTFEGKVVAETKFAECTHPVEQQIWSRMIPQPDGSFIGLHQWYYESSSCILNPTLGPTAWRVLAGEGGTRYLRACFSSPGGSQPRIATDGTSSEVTYGCVSSALIAPLPAAGALSLKQLASLPGARKCLSRRSFKVHLRDPVHDPFRSIVVTLAGRELKVTHHGSYSVATVSLKGLPRGTFTIRIRATTVLGRILAAHRTYHTCAPRPPASRRHGMRHGRAR